MPLAGRTKVINQDEKTSKLFEPSLLFYPSLSLASCRINAEASMTYHAHGPFAKKVHDA